MCSRLQEIPKAQATKVCPEETPHSQIQTGPRQNFLSIYKFFRQHNQRYLFICIFRVTPLRHAVSVSTTLRRVTSCGSCRVIMATTPNASTLGWSRPSGSVPSAESGSLSLTSAALDSYLFRQRMRLDQTRTRTMQETARPVKRQPQPRLWLPLLRQRGSLSCPRPEGHRGRATHNGRGATFAGEMFWIYAPALDTYFTDVGVFPGIIRDALIPVNLSETSVDRGLRKG